MGRRTQLLLMQLLNRTSLINIRILADQGFPMNIGLMQLFNELKNFFSDAIYDIYLILLSPTHYFKEHLEDKNTIAHKTSNIAIFSSLIILAMAVYYGIKKEDAWNITTLITLIVKRIFGLSLVGFVIYIILYPFKHKCDKFRIIQTVVIVLSTFSIIYALIYFSFLSLETAGIYYLLYAALVFLFISLFRSLAAITELSAIKIGPIILLSYILLCASIVGVDYIKAGGFNESYWLHASFRNPL